MIDLAVKFVTIESSCDLNDVEQMKTQRVVIIGASHAAAEMVTSLRKQGWEGEIVVVGAEEYLPYHRPPLSKAYFQGDLIQEKLEIKSKAVYERASVEFRLGTQVQRIDREQGCVVLKNSNAEETQVLKYDYLVLATGTRARQLSADGAGLANISTLRTISDVAHIQSTLEHGNRLLIIGAGYIGLELAASAVKLGLQVAVLEAMERVLARVTGEDISRFYQSLHQSHGVDLRLQSALSHFSKEKNDTVANLCDGEKIVFDCAVVGIGVVPNQELAAEAGLLCENGIVVDEYTRTADERIFAIGDCSNHPSRLYERRIRLESVPNAVEQAKTAAAAICGKQVAYDQVPWFWSDQYDIKLQTAGLLSGYDQAIVRGEPESKKFSVAYLRDDRLIALDAINSPGDFMVARKLIAAKATPDPVRLTDASEPLKELL